MPLSCLASFMYSVIFIVLICHSLFTHFPTKGINESKLRYWKVTAGETWLPLAPNAFLVSPLTPAPQLHASGLPQFGSQRAPSLQLNLWSRFDWQPRSSVINALRIPSWFRRFHQVLKIEQVPNACLSELGELGVPFKVSLRYNSFITGTLASG